MYFVPKVLTVHTNLHINVYRNIFACEELQPFQLSSRYNMPVCVCVCVCVVRLRRYRLLPRRCFPLLYNKGMGNIS